MIAVGTTGHVYKDFFLYFILMINYIEVVSIQQNLESRRVENWET